MKVAIIGRGVEGKSALEYFSGLKPKPEITVVEGNVSEIDFVPYSVIVRSPSAPLHDLKAKLEADKAGSHDYNLTSATKIFFSKCPAPIIGVTGTKGKGTTCSLIAEALRAAGKTVHLVGNIGHPSLDELGNIRPEDIVVYEMSSFQLWDMDTSPQTAVIVHLEPDHLDVHKHVEDYLGAKANIVKHQSEGDSVIYDADNELSAAMAEKSAGQKIAYPSKDHAHIKGSSFYYGENRVCSLKDLKIPGAHNQKNALAAIDACWQYTDDPNSYKIGLGNFTGLPHRLKFVKKVHGVDYYDDSISTTIGSTIAAIKSFEQPKVLILGGSSKGADFAELVDEITKSNIRQVILMGAEADNIEELLVKAGQENYTNLGADTDMEAVRWAADSADYGDVVLLSPACASFGMFKNYSDRGEQFVAAVEGL